MQQCCFLKRKKGSTCSPTGFLCPLHACDRVNHIFTILETPMQSTRSIRLVVKIFSLIIALALCAPSLSLARPHARRAPQQQEQQQRIPPRQLIPERNFDTQHIKLDLRFDWEREQTVGTESFTFMPLTNDFRSFELDAANMTFSSVKLANGTPLKFEPDTAHEKLRITMDRAYQL